MRSQSAESRQKPSEHSALILTLAIPTPAQPADLLRDRVRKACDRVLRRTARSEIDHESPTWKVEDLEPVPEERLFEGDPLTQNLIRVCLHEKKAPKQRDPLFLQWKETHLTIRKLLRATRNRISPRALFSRLEATIPALRTKAKGLEDQMRERTKHHRRAKLAKITAMSYTQALRHFGLQHAPRSKSLKSTISQDSVEEHRRLWSSIWCPSPEDPCPSATPQPHTDPPICIGHPTTLEEVVRAARSLKSGTAAAASGITTSLI